MTNIFQLIALAARRAQRMAQRGLLVEPGSSAGRCLLGFTEYSLGHTSEAQHIASEVLRFDPGFPDAYLLLAHIHERQHDPNSVVADVENYFKVASNDELRGEALGLLHNAQQDLAGASASPK